MPDPMELAASTRDEVKNIEEFFSGVNSEALVKGFEQMTSSGTNKMKLWGGKTTTQDRASITIRFTPELHKKWLELIADSSTSQAINPADVKKRASGEFAAAFKNGQLVIEVNKDGKRTLYASKETAANMNAGNLKLAKRNGESPEYTIKVIDHEGFAAIANSFMTNMQLAQAPTAHLSSDAITATAELKAAGAAPIATNQTQFTVQKSADKKVSLTTTPTKIHHKSEATEDNEALQVQERTLEAERAKKDEALAEEKEEERQEIKTETQELRQEEIKKEEAKVETTKEDTHVLDAIKAEEESSSQSGETVP